MARFFRRRGTRWRRRYLRRAWRSRKPRFRRGRRRLFRGGINSTRSRTVRISAQLPLTLTGTTSTTPPTYFPVPLVFTPSQLAGFTDYASTFSEFRILKAVCKVHLALPGDSEQDAPLSNQPYTYLRVASRPFIESSVNTATGANSGGSPNLLINLLSSPATRQSYTTLRQSRWQRQYYPSDIKNSITFKFYPYTLEWQGRPVGSLSSASPTYTQFQYLKYRSARQWMPMSFLGPDLATSADDVSFLGPYFCRLLSTEADTQAVSQWSPVCTLSIYCQFRGQK